MNETVQEISNKTIEDFAKDIAYTSAHNQELYIQYILNTCEDGNGLDGLALDLVLATALADGELFTDEECLYIVGCIVDKWLPMREALNSI